MNIILVEDDMPLCKTLVHIVRLYAPSVNLVACCHTVQEAQSALMHHKPDLVLADVRLPDGTGFDALMEVQQALNCHTLPFPVAFMTADTQSQNALDYLQTMLFFKPMGFLRKPFSDTTLIALLHKAARLSGLELTPGPFTPLLPEEEHIGKIFPPLPSLPALDAPSGKRSERGLMVHVGNERVPVKMKMILYCNTVRNGVELHCTNGETFVRRSTLAEYEQHLGGAGFIRVHRSFIINMLHIAKYTAERIVMSNGKSIPLAEERSKAVREIFKKYFAGGGAIKAVNGEAIELL